MDEEIVKGFESGEENLEMDAVLNWKSVKVAENRRAVVSLEQEWVSGLGVNLAAEFWMYFYLWRSEVNLGVMKAWMRVSAAEVEVEAEPNMCNVEE